VAVGGKEKDFCIFGDFFLSPHPGSLPPLLPVDHNLVGIHVLAMFSTPDSSLFLLLRKERKGKALLII